MHMWGGQQGARTYSLDKELWNHMEDADFFFFFMTAPNKIPSFSLLLVKPFCDSHVSSMDKGNCMVFLIGHHTYLSSPSVTQRTLPSTTFWPSIISRVWDYRGFSEQLSPPYPITSSRASLLSTSEVRSTAPPPTVHHGWQVRERTASEWQCPRKPGVHKV